LNVRTKADKWPAFVYRTT